MRHLGINSIRLIVLFGFLTLLLSEGGTNTAIVGGWSRGATPALCAASDLEEILVGPHACFLIDPRMLTPCPPVTVPLRQIQALDADFLKKVACNARLMDEECKQRF